MSKGPKPVKHANGVFYVHWTEGNRSRRESLGVKTELEAAARLTAWAARRNSEIEAASSASVAELWAVYDEKHVRPKLASQETAKYVWQNLEPEFGTLIPQEIDQARIDRYAAKRERGTIGRPSKGPTIRRELATLTACLNWCADPRRKLLDKSNVPAFIMPEPGEPRDRWLRTAEIQALIEAAGAERMKRRSGKVIDGRLSRAERFLWLALETGARKSAILQLTWDRVDFDTKIVHLFVPGAKRTKKRRADVPISRTLLPVLRRAHAERNGNHVLDNEAEIWKAIAAIAKRAKVADVSPNVLRHTAATHMARRGVPLWIIAGILANTVQMVEKVYAKHCPEGLASGVEMISAGLLDAAE